MTLNKIIDSGEVIFIQEISKADKRMKIRIQGRLKKDEDLEEYLLVFTKTRSILQDGERVDLFYNTDTDMYTINRSGYHQSKAFVAMAEEYDPEKHGIIKRC